MNALLTAFPADLALVHGVVTRITVGTTKAGAEYARVSVRKPGAQTRSFPVWDGLADIVREEDAVRSLSIFGTGVAVGASVTLFVSIESVSTKNADGTSGYAEYKLGSVQGAEVR